MPPKKLKADEARALVEQAKLKIAELESALRKKTDQAERALAAAERIKKASQPQDSVPEPKGPGIWPHIRREHRLKKKAYLSSAHTWTHWACLDSEIHWKLQDVTKVTVYFAKMREAHPELAIYDNHWVERRVAIQFFQNQRRHAVKLARLAESVPDEEDDEDDEEDPANFSDN